MLTKTGNKALGTDMMRIINDLWSLRRDIVSDGYDRALEYINGILPLKVHEFKTGTKCWTWTVPEKWSVNEAYISNGSKRVLDLKDHPLHVISYSLPVDKEVPREELLSHLHTRPDRPGAIPFEFKYYERDWGFCMAHEKLESLDRERYRVFIDSRFEKGSLKVGEIDIRGKMKDTILIVAHLCHPCMANDDLSGVAAMIGTAGELLQKKGLRYSYKFLLVPETIGSIAYLSANDAVASDIKYGIFLEMLGNDNSIGLQFSYQGDTMIDEVAEHCCARSLKEFRRGAFRTIVRNDEMVYNGPGVNIPMISLSRYPYPEYHTSDDNPGIISRERIEEAKRLLIDITDVFERDFVPVRKFKGPVFLSGCGMMVDWRKDRALKGKVELLMMNLEGELSVFEIARKIGMDFEQALGYVLKFREHGLLDLKQDKPEASI